MFTTNPYAQAGWYNPQNPHSINNAPWRSSGLPPTFGLLPPTDSRPTSILTFEFAFNPDIFNSLVMGPKQMEYFQIKSTPNTTVFSKPGSEFASIHWGSHPTVEAKGVLARQRTKEFLKISPDQTYRTMTISGRTYAWIPRDSGIYLYSVGPSPPLEFARLTMAGNASLVKLEITSEAFQVGLFEPTIIAAVLLFSGRNIN